MEESGEPPSEGYCAKRRIRMSSRARRMKFALSAALGTALAFGANGMYRQTAYYDAFRTRGVHTKGCIEAIVTNGPGNYVTYEYTTPQGLVRDNKYLDIEGLSQMHIGDWIPITYLPENPENSIGQVVDSSFVAQYRKSWILCTILFGIGIEGAAWAFRCLVVRERLFLLNGIQVSATVLDIATARSGIRSTLSLTYAYRDLQGLPVRKTIEVRLEMLRRIQENNPLVALVPPDGGEPVLMPQLSHVALDKA